jgi:excisionase family DNA binding protein
MAAAAPAAPPRLLTYREFAEALGVSERTVFEWVKTGAVKAVRLGPKCVRFNPDERDRVMREGVSS